MNKVKIGNSMRCEICGKFIGYKELENNEVRYKFTPDTDFGPEYHEFTHEKCINKLENNFVNSVKKLTFVS